MKKLSCDVLVVGAGPAGLATARATAMRGLKTVVIEEHAEIGEPVQCGEAIGEYLFLSRLNLFLSSFACSSLPPSISSLNEIRATSERFLGEIL